ncbi:hypothetical protein [Variovorax sp. PBL-E5]|nr:hypothetical protein [Variovorax sp. PBL-E5]VTU39421.1 hypothetical protein E5CHR_05080 [Variovorax sp. PBL-E5]
MALVRCVYELSDDFFAGTPLSGAEGFRTVKLALGLKLNASF